jgi:hypothetical protein
MKTRETGSGGRLLVAAANVVMPSPSPSLIGLAALSWRSPANKRSPSPVSSAPANARA